MKTKEFVRCDLITFPFINVIFFEFLYTILMINLIFLFGYQSALRENGRKMEKSTIVVMKSSSGGGEDGFRSRGPKKDAWGNNTWNKDRNSGGGAAAANTSTASVEGADWSSADWSSGGDANTSSNDNYGDGEDRRSSRGRGRGGRDRGGRGGGRGLVDCFLFFTFFLITNMMRKMLFDYFWTGTRFPMTIQSKGPSELLEISDQKTLNCST